MQTWGNTEVSGGVFLCDFLCSASPMSSILLGLPHAARPAGEPAHSAIDQRTAAGSMCVV